MKLWVSFRNRGGQFPDIAWELIGIFDTREAAWNILEKDNDGIFSVELNKSYPGEPVEPEECRYKSQGEPNAKE